MANIDGKHKDGNAAAIIERLRTTLNLSQTELGDRLGYSAMSISRWERGTAAPPPSALIAIAKLTTTKTDFWVLLAMAGLSRSLLASAVRQK